MIKKNPCWHKVSEFPPEHTSILVMAHHELLGLRFDVEYTSHIANWRYFVQHHQIVAWCNIPELFHLMPIHAVMTKAIGDELRMAIERADFRGGRLGGTNCYEAYETKVKYFKFLVNLLKGIFMKDNLEGFEDLVTEIERLQAQINTRRDFVAKTLEKVGEDRYDSKALMQRLEFADAAIDGLESVKEFISDASLV